MSEKIVIEVDQDLKDLIPGFLKNVQNNISIIRDSVASGDFEKVKVLGHNMKGSGGGYGFDEITSIGLSIEQAAREGNGSVILLKLSELETYLTSIEIKYVAL